MLASVLRFVLVMGLVTCIVGAGAWFAESMRHKKSLRNKE
jgi:hypothetical protein